MEKTEFIDALYHIVNTTEQLKIATLIEEPEEPALYVELMDGSRFHILVTPTTLHF